MSVLQIRTLGEVKMRLLSQIKCKLNAIPIKTTAKFPRFKKFNEKVMVLDQLNNFGKKREK